MPTNGNNGEMSRAVGRLEAESSNHNERLTRIEEKLDHIVTVIDQAKGSWKTLVAVGTISAAITTTVLKISGAFGLSR